MSATLKILIFLLLSCISCDTKKSSRQGSKPGNDTIVIVNSNKNTTITQEKRKYPKDTLLKSGWHVSYFTKDDSTRDSDLYIQCSKIGNNYTYLAPEVLQFRSYFIPTYIGESENCIYFKTACATNCKAILIFYKDAKRKFELFNSVIDFSIPNETIVFIDDEADDSGNYVIWVANLKKKIMKSVQFSNYCNVLPREGCIDSVKFSQGKVDVFATLNSGKDYYNDSVVKEKYRIDTN